MDFIRVTKDNFEEAIALRPKRSQYPIIFRDTLVRVLAMNYVDPPERPTTPCLIEDGGRLVGFLTTRDLGNSVRFYAFFIDRRYQGKGLGQRAMLHLIDWVKEHCPNARGITCGVHPENAVARHVYEAVGFHYTGEVNRHGLLEMELQLETS